jgi:hypothetical protein
LLQKPWPALGWNSSVPHAKHEARLLALVNMPGAHGVQVRSDVALGAKSSRSPGMHAVAFVSGHFWESMQKCAGGHAAHVPLLLLPYVPSGQLAPHVVAPGSELKVPQVHFSQGAALVPALNFPAVQFAHTPPELAWPAPHTTVRMPVHVAVWAPGLP